MTLVELSRTVLHAVRRVVDEGELSVAVPARVVVERPRPGGCGDYATGVALQLARPAGRAPRQIAALLREQLLLAPGVAGVEITGPGFLNITLDGPGLPGLVRDILRSGTAYGHVGAEPVVHVGAEPVAHVVAEPVVHVGAEPVAHHAPVLPGSPATPLRLRLLVAPGVRAAVLADAVARILRSQGVPALLRYEDGAEPDAAWADLGVLPRVGPASSADPVPSTPIRPLPAPADPLPLGRDAGRWALLYPAAHDRPRITEDHLVQRESNPLFRVRYAHARTRALLRNAADLGFTSVPGDLSLPADASGDLAPLGTALSDHPQVLATAARRRAPDVLARHLVATADAYLAYQGAVRILPVGDEKPSAAHRARLALAEAAGTVLAGGLALLGIDAPETI